jgi:hypothetical protein
LAVRIAVGASVSAISLPSPPSARDPGSTRKFDAIESAVLQAALPEPEEATYAEQ